MKRKPRTRSLKKKTATYKRTINSKSKKSVSNPAATQTTIPLCFPDRYHPQYLAYLLKTLDLKNLADSAATVKKKIGKKTFKRRISIDFCGIAANTLLGSDMGPKKMSDPAQLLRKEVRVAFGKLFDRKSLLQLNRNGIYVRIRFCFSYLYADYPICLMKAELPDVWDKIINAEQNEFYISPPLTLDQFIHSRMNQSQLQSLSEVVDIVTEKNEGLVILGNHPRKANTIQVRFNVIPSPMCGLIINDRIAFCDTYLYAKIEGTGQLSLNYPLNVIDSKRNKIAFQNVQQHFNYLWRHDLTLYCSDGTFFETMKNKRTGLARIRQPWEIVGDGEGKSNWKQKEKRIRDKIIEEARKKRKTPIINDDDIMNWKDNLNHKFDISTRKMVTSPSIVATRTVPKVNTDKMRGKVRLYVGMKGDKFCFEINFWDEGIDCFYISFSNNLLYSVLAHYAFALCAKDDPKPTPVLYDNFPKDYHFLDQLRKRLYDSNTNLAKRNTDLLSMLFNMPPKFGLKTEGLNIDFDLARQNDIGDATYTTSQKEEGEYISRGCLDYRLVKQIILDESK